MTKKKDAPKGFLGVATDLRRREILEKYCQGFSVAEIAAEIGITKGAINRHIGAMRKEWKQHRLEMIDDQKADIENGIRKVMREAWLAWYRSCEDQEVVREGKKMAHGEPAPYSEKIRKGQAGDPRFLDQVRSCLDQLVKLYGLNEPDKMDVNHHNNPLIVDLVVGSREEARKLTGLEAEVIDSRVVDPSEN